MRTNYFLIFCCLYLFQSGFAQTFNIVLGRPTDQSVTVSALFGEVVQVCFEYGISPSSLTQSTPTMTSEPATPVVIDLQPLEANTRYFYRAVYKKPNQQNFQFGEVHSFHTQRAVGTGFTFLIEADEHLYDKKGVLNLYQICLQNQAKDSADFMFSLGDTFGDDHTPLETTSDDMRQLHLDYRELLGAVCHSMPFFFCLGNHEGESGYWLDQTPPENIAVYGTQWRKFYYPNPFPNDFYSGNMTEEPYGIGQPENYYAFTWGDALFVVLDVYRDCDVDEKPQKWDWTLGETQYNWLKTTLETSTAAHKFVFAHHTRGQGRGGILTASGFEWGGMDGNQYKFDQYRPGWAMPIHQLMVANGVDIFFQGHDHLFAKEELDGLVYQEVPMPSDSTYEIGMLANADAYVSDTLDGSGHLRVRVEPTCVTVDYVAAYLPADTSATQQNGQVRFSYTVGDCSVSTVEGRKTDSPFYTLSPNPTQGKFTLEASAATAHDRRMEVVNLQGKLVWSGVLEAGVKDLKMDLEESPGGIYCVRIADKDTLTALKMVILK